MKLPTFQVGEIGKNVVGVHTGFANGNIAADEKWNFRSIPKCGNEGMASGQRIDGRAHVQEKGLDGVRVRVSG